MCEVATFLKVGTTAVVLKMIEDEFLPDLSLDGPVQALHEVSWDPTLRRTVRLADGRSVTAIELQWEFLDHAKKWVKENEDVPANADVLQRWESVLTGLEDDPSSMHRELDWVAKHRLLEAYRDRDGLAWDDPKLGLIDLQYHDVRRNRGLFHRLAAAGKVERIASEAEIERAMRRPPEDTRAYFRGNCIARYPDAIMAASWDSVIFDTGRDALQRVPMREPLKGTRDMVDGLFDRAEDAGALVDLLQG
jgi:proteasome accessory factor A